ncbi:hypothetical protein L5515_002042 [Caenorhabditis briggsae]|uniref:Uncharacterized protein n=1 Tax=Caenorhabditis briggsae TaxID=6238 RepID=A0AAE9E6H0_CAEBR|nr:hypothetical protein L5515_002042 [Caenorhabditis briggsae]
MGVINVKRSGVPQIEGNGAFLGQSVKKHQCLGEYVGESIPDEEIERRGAEFHFSCSYIFNSGQGLGTGVDAMRTGNNLRFLARGHTRRPGSGRRADM